MVTFWAYLRFHLLLWSLRAAWRVTRWLVTAAVLIAAAPVTVVAAVAYAGAWLRGWPPAKLWRAAAWALPMTGVYLAGRALAGPHLARPGPGPGARLGARLAPGPGRAGADRVRAVRPGRGARRAGRRGHWPGPGGSTPSRPACPAAPPPPPSSSTPASGAGRPAPPAPASPPPAPCRSPTGRAGS